VSKAIEHYIRIVETSEEADLVIDILREYEAEGKA